jgi:SnoaL-like domain
MTNTDTNTSTGTDLSTIVDVHLAAYCEPDAAHRAALIASVWQPDGRLLDPPFDGSGHDGIAALAEAVLAHYPGHTFRRTSAVDAHHDVARYRWELVAPDGAVAVAGTDVADLVDGRLARVVGFFGEQA